MISGVLGNRGLPPGEQLNVESERSFISSPHEFDKFMRKRRNDQLRQEYDDFQKYQNPMDLTKYVPERSAIDKQVDQILYRNRQRQIDKLKNEIKQSKILPLKRTNINERLAALSAAQRDEEALKRRKINFSGFLRKQNNHINTYVPPQPILVGVEPNPGPKGPKKPKKVLVVQRKKKNLRGTKPRKRVLASNSLGMSVRTAPVSIGYTSVMKNKLRNTMVSHCEQLAEITAANASSYSLQVALQVNPGLPTVFPWLSQVASNYEAYEFKKLEFYFIPYVSSATAGYNAMNFDYNPQEESSTQFPTKQSFTDYDGSIQCNAWEGFRMGIKCPNLEGPRVRTIRTGAVTGQYDLHNYDHGQFNFAVGGSTGTSAIGTLYVCYNVLLMRPRISSLGSGQVELGAGVTGWSNGGTVSGSLTLGTVANVAPVHSDSTIGLYVNASGALGTGSTNSIWQLSSSLTQAIPFTSTNTYMFVGQWTGTNFVVIPALASIAASSSYTVQIDFGWSANKTASTGATALTGGGIVQMNGTFPDILGFATINANLAEASITSVSFHVVQMPFGLSLSASERRFEKYMNKLIIERMNDKFRDLSIVPKQLDDYCQVEEEKEEALPLSTFLSRNVTVKKEQDVVSIRSTGKR